MKYLFRGLIFAGIILLIIWLGFTTSSKRISQINLAIKENKFPALKTSEKRDLDSILGLIAYVSQASKLYHSDSPSVKHVSSANKVRIIVSSPVMEKWTGCGKGNAVYDSKLGVIFLDISLLRPTDWMLYEPRSGIELLESDLPFLKVYLTFILLHELGHHELKHGSKGFLNSFNNKKNGKHGQREQDADQYAYSAFQKLLDQNNLIWERANDASDIRVENATIDDKTSIALLVMLQNMTLSMQFGLSPFSPFYFDKDHPTYLDRAKGIVGQIINNKNVQKDIADRALVLQTSINAFQSIPKRCSLTEISLQKTVLDMACSSDDVTMIPVSGPGFYRTKISKIDLGTPGKLGSATLNQNNFTSAKRDFDSTHQVITFTLKNKQSYCLIKGRPDVYQLTNQSMKLLPVAAFHSAFLPSVDVFPTSIPYEHAIVTSSTILSSVVSENDVRKIDLKSLAQTISTKLNLDTIQFEYLHPLLHNGEVGLLFTSGQDSLKQYGLVVLNSISWEIIATTLFQLPISFFHQNKYGNKFDFGENAFFFLHKNEKFDYYLTTVEKQKESNVSWVLWRVHESRVPELIYKTDFLAKSTKNSRIINLFDPYMFRQRITSVSPHQFLMNWNADYVYMVDFQEKKATPIFYPGDENLDIRTNGSGTAVFFIQGTQRVYLERF